MRRQTSFLLIAIAAAAAACASLEDYRRPDGTLDGERLYMKRCGSCHDPFPRTDYSAVEWRDHVEHYGPRAGLDAEARRAVLKWLNDGPDRR